MSYDSLPKKYYTNKFKNCDVVKVGNGYNFEIRGKHLGEKLDYAQDVVDAQVWSDMKSYMPIDTGNLISQTNVVNSSIRGYVYAFPENSEYGHYQYEGEKYVDPLTGISGFYIDGVGWRSRAGVAKVPSGKPLTYSNPNASKHWDKKALRNHKKEWVAVAKRALGVN